MKLSKNKMMELVKNAVHFEYSESEKQILIDTINILYKSDDINASNLKDFLRETDLINSEITIK